jgi:two-component system OmpR family sensor kinase
VGRAAGADGDTAVLEVRDHGQGLSPEQAERVFERFYRIDSSGRRGTGGGSGLGLSIVAAVVAAHSGHVRVLPTPGGGATFQVTLPARTEDPRPSPGTPVQPGTAASGGRVTGAPTSGPLSVPRR